MGMTGGGKLIEENDRKGGREVVRDRDTERM